MPRLRPTDNRCVCCRRAVKLTFHHLLPKKIHRRARFRKTMSKNQLNEGIYVCRLCHRGIHRCYDEMTLATRFSSLAELLADETLTNHFLWVSKQKETTESPDWR